MASYTRPIDTDRVLQVYVRRSLSMNDTPTSSRRPEDVTVTRTRSETAALQQRVKMEAEKQQKPLSSRVSRFFRKSFTKSQKRTKKREGETNDEVSSLCHQNSQRCNTKDQSWRKSFKRAFSIKKKGSTRKSDRCSGSYRSSDKVDGEDHSDEVCQKAAEQLHELAGHLTQHLPTISPIRSASNIRTSPDGPAESDSEKQRVLIRHIVELLAEQGDEINEKITSDSILKVLGSLSYRNFQNLADIVVANVPPLSSSIVSPNNACFIKPELSKIALTMELTKKLAGLGGSAVYNVIAHGSQYLTDTFGPWIRQQGGWAQILATDLSIEIEAQPIKQ
uniref:uncharacterized protein n=1 Tax=Myxine glutinosa TaxID=7769 RepID=UPI00358DF01E